LSFLTEARGTTAESQMRRTGRLALRAPSFVDIERLSNPIPARQEKSLRARSWRSRPVPPV